jgi:hypothetical protein
MHFSYIGIVAVLLSSVIGTTIPSFDDNASLSSPILETRAPPIIPHFKIQFKLGTTDNQIKALKIYLPQKLPRVALSWNQVEMLRMTKFIKLYVEGQDAAAVKNFLGDAYWVVSAAWVDGNDQGLMDKRTPQDAMDTEVLDAKSPNYRQL